MYKLIKRSEVKVIFLKIIQLNITYITKLFHFVLLNAKVSAILGYIHISKLLNKFE